MAMSKETILTQGYELPLGAFQLFGVSRRHKIPWWWWWWLYEIGRYVFDIYDPTKFHIRS